MEYGIQRRSVYLVPPDAEALEWIFEMFDRPEIYADLGLSAPAGAELRKRKADGDHVFAVIHTAPSLSLIHI